MITELNLSSCQVLFFLFLDLGSIRAIARYPLNKKTGPRDTSVYGNPPARIPRGVKFAPGPDKRPFGSIKFPLRRRVYIRIPNRKRILDTKNALSYLVWVYPTGRNGVIISHGIKVAIERNGRLTVSILRRRRRPVSLRVPRAVRLPRRRWSHIAVTYLLKRKLGKYELYYNNRRIMRVFRRVIPNTRGSPLVGGFSGRISCLQFYQNALRGRQIARRMKRCFRKYLKLFVLFTLLTFKNILN